MARRVVDALRELAHAAPAERAILDPWERGFIECCEVMQFTRLTEREYEAAMQRIRRLVKRLPPEFLEAVNELLRRAS